MKAIAFTSFCAAAILFFPGDRPHAQPAPVRLWEGAVPGARGTDPDSDVPRLYPYLPDSTKASGCAVIICPGGGYWHLPLLWGGEGSECAEWFAQRGVAGFLLRYRTASGGYHRREMIADISRAIRLVRSRAHAWGLDSSRVGVVGFSAGGHLASTISTHWDQGNPKASDSVDRPSCRPSFSVLVYPVITMDRRWTYIPGIESFFGTAQPSKALTDSFSNERQITAATPPAFLAHDPGDWEVPVINSYMYRDSCTARGVPVRLHTLVNCGHGCGLKGYWADSAMAWLESRGMLRWGTGVIHQVRAVEGVVRSGTHPAVGHEGGAVTRSLFDMQGRKQAVIPGPGRWRKLH